MTTKYFFSLAIESASLVAVMAVLLPFGARADVPGKHPYYLHALSDLRTARSLIERRPGDARVSGHEDVAIREIDAAIGEIKAASIDDGKDLHDHPAIDVSNEHNGRLHRAVEVLKKVERDLSKEEDNPTVRNLRSRAEHHVGNAIHETESALYDIEHHR